ncbi:hypothetical protein KAM450_14170 [Aeromonas caviae]|nr:hypothetical protein KAM374_20420 [Aeromonas caviae]GKQ88169.1 hypothetical protein KAM450_14170 [Aeromonas caviae]
MARWRSEMMHSGANNIKTAPKEAVLIARTPPHMGEASLLLSQAAGEQGAGGFQIAAEIRPGMPLVRHHKAR